MMSPEEAYKYDTTFKKLVDTMRAFLAEYSVTPAELRQAAMLASTMHEALRIRPMFVYYNNEFPMMIGSTSGRWQTAVPNITEVEKKHGTITPFTEHVFSRTRSNHRACVRCNLSDVYVQFFGVKTCTPKEK